MGRGKKRGFTFLFGIPTLIDKYCKKIQRPAVVKSAKTWKNFHPDKPPFSDEILRYIKAIYED